MAIVARARVAARRKNTRAVARVGTCLRVHAGPVAKARIHAVELARRGHCEAGAQDIRLSFDRHLVKPVGEPELFEALAASRPQGEAAASQVG